MRWEAAGRRSRRNRGRAAGILVLVAAVGAACGSSEPAGPGGSERADRAAPSTEAPAAPEENAPPVVEWVRVEPSRPLPNSRLRAFARAEDPDGDPVRLEYRWQLDGREIGAGDSLVLRDVERGDTVELVVMATDGRSRSMPARARVRVANQPPLLSGVVLDAPDGLTAGAKVVASPQAVDADGDDLRFEYEWRVNGERLPVEGPVLETERMQRGDVVEVTVVARDGYDESERRTSDPVTLGNTPPRIVSQPAWEREGDTFRYAVEARDPDGDRTLRYRVLEGPPGMQIDAIEGVLTWSPEPGQEGRHPVEIEVDDLQGGRTAQRFEVVMELDGPAAQAPAAAAPSY